MGLSLRRGGGALQRLMDIDRERVHTITLEDHVAMAGQGRITDRGEEHLGKSDGSIIALRRLWGARVEGSRRGAAFDSAMPSVDRPLDTRVQRIEGRGVDRRRPPDREERDIRDDAGFLSKR